MKELIRTENLKKSYGERFCLGPISLKLAAGETIALLGKNGSGKTTLLQLLTGNADSTDGKIFFSEKIPLLPDSNELKRNIGYLPQHLELPQWVTTQDLLLYAASLLELDDGVEKVKQQLAYWDCNTFVNIPLGACSYGMQKRAGLALATLHRPEFLVLDEPFAGLDIYHVRALEDLLKKRKSSSKLTLIATHEPFYAARHCDRAISLDFGKFAELTPWANETLTERIKIVETFFFGRP